ncbi:MAG: MATE family efflux transporter, partial [Lachnospiraceae bacterium]|nr:MATE family efflux transporter [Lachnospiraceae bacterium]
MNQEACDLTTGSLWKKILLFSFPLMISNVLQVLFNMSDIAVVGQFAGPLALGAVGSTTTLVAMFTAFLIGMGGGVNALVARYFGSRNEKDISETVHSSAIISVGLGIVILLLGQISSPWILSLLGTKPELLEGAMLYLRIYFLGMPAMAVYNFGNAVFGAVGNTKKPLLFLSAAGVINVLLNLTFVIGFHLDVAGVAIASVISQYISAVLIIQALIKSEGTYGLRKKELRLNPKKTKQILS